MKSLAVGLLIILSVFSIVSAQSGRRVKPTPTPVQAQTETVREADYSESTPSAARPSYSQPASRDNKNKSNNKAKTLPPVQTTAQASTGGDDDVLKIETNLITIPVSVYERSGVYVPNLRQADFKIFENGVEQEIAYFGNSDKPFTVVLLIDVSPSTAYKIEEIQSAARAFVDQLKPEDRVMVVEFDRSVRVLAELTNDRNKMYEAINRADFGDGTSLYEAVDYSLRKRLSKIEGRKAIVLFTDGVDTTSRGASFDKTVREAEESDSIIFPIYYNTFLSSRGIGQGGVMSTPPTLGSPFPGSGGMSSQGTSSAEHALGRAYLEGLAGATGGRVFRPESTPGGLNAAFEGIAEELRRQYSIGYYPKEEGQNGERKQIKVRVNRPAVAVRARDSYIVGGAGSQSQSSK